MNRKNIFERNQEPNFRKNNYSNSPRISKIKRKYPMRLSLLKNKNNRSMSTVNKKYSETSYRKPKVTIHHPLRFENIFYRNLEIPIKYYHNGVELKNYKPNRISVGKKQNYLRPSILYPRNRSCLLYTSPSPRDGLLSRMPSSA